MFFLKVQQELILSMLTEGYHKVLGVSSQSEAFKGLQCPIKCWIAKPCLSMACECVFVSTVYNVNVFFVCLFFSKSSHLHQGF